MAEGFDKRYQTTTRYTVDAAIDEGLRAHMLKVYNYMGSGLALTGIVAYATAQSPALLNFIYGNTLIMWTVLLAPLGLVIYMSARVHKMSFSALQTSFWIYAGVMGLSMSFIFLIYTQASIARVFFISASMFGAMSLYGYTTKKDLSGWGSFLFMGLIGIIIASIVNMFMASSALYFAISVIGVLIFVGLTAYDTQKIKEMYLASDGTEIAGKKAVMGALKLYLDFINLFLMMLRLFGNRN